MRTILAASFALNLLAPALALAADHEVKMLNKDADGAAMVFEPMVVKAVPGDTITFAPVDKGHLSVSMKNGIPDGAQSWAGKMNEKLTITVTQPGVYMYQCTPHAGMGMIGAIVVGDPINLGQVKALKFPGKAKKTAESIFAQIGG